MITHSSSCGLATITIWDALRDLVPFVQFKKRENYPWRGGTFSKVAGCITNFSAASTDRPSNSMLGYSSDMSVS